MTLFPFNTNWKRQAQSDVAGIKNSLQSVVKYDPGAMAAADTNYYVESANMKVGAYTLAHTSPARGARNITVTQTAVDAEDTNGTILVTGTDLAGATITETITPNAGATVAGTKAFKTVTSIVGAGWVIGGGNDTIIVGFGDVIGLPDKLSDTAQVVAASKNNVKEGTAPTVTVSSSVLASNTVDLSTAMDGDGIVIYYMV
jgi:hypothetical protein